MPHFQESPASNSADSSKSNDWFRHQRPDMSDHDLALLSSASQLMTSLLQYLFAGRQRRPPPKPEHGVTDMQLHTFRTGAAPLEMGPMQSHSHTSTLLDSLQSHCTAGAATAVSPPHGSAQASTSGEGPLGPPLLAPEDQPSAEEGGAHGGVGSATETAEVDPVADFCLRYMQRCLRSQHRQQQQQVAECSGAEEDETEEEEEEDDGIASAWRLAEACRDGVAPW